MLDVVIFILDKIKDLISISAEKRDLAISEIENAYLLTEKYYAGHEIEKSELSQAWMSAAIALKDIDSGIYNICRHKSSYWNNPEIWSNNDISSARIKLDHVRQIVNALKNKSI